MSSEDNESESIGTEEPKIKKYKLKPVDPAEAVQKLEERRKKDREAQRKRRRAAKEAAAIKPSAVKAELPPQLLVDAYQKYIHILEKQNDAWEKENIELKEKLEQQKEYVRLLESFEENQEKRRDKRKRDAKEKPTAASPKKSKK